MIYSIEISIGTLPQLLFHESYNTVHAGKKRRPDTVQIRIRVPGLSAAKGVGSDCNNVIAL